MDLLLTLDSIVTKTGQESKLELHHNFPHRSPTPQVIQSVGRLIELEGPVNALVQSESCDTEKFHEVLQITFQAHPDAARRHVVRAMPGSRGEMGLT